MIISRLESKLFERCMKNELGEFSTILSNSKAHRLPCHYPAEQGPSFGFFSTFSGADLVGFGVQTDRFVGFGDDSVFLGAFLIGECQAILRFCPFGRVTLVILKVFYRFHSTNISALV